MRKVNIRNYIRQRVSLNQKARDFIKNFTTFSKRKCTHTDVNSNTSKSKSIIIIIIHHTQS